MSKKPDLRRVCPEYAMLSRRQFVNQALLAATISSCAGGIPTFIRSIRIGASDARGAAIVSIFLRGGADGLSFCVPYQDKEYYRARPNIAIPPPDSSNVNRSIALDDHWALAKALEPLHTAFQAGHLLVMHGVGLPATTKSHFVAQRFMESGTFQENTVSSGWLARHLQFNKRPSVLRAVALASALPATLFRSPSSLAIADPVSFRLEGDLRSNAERRAFLRQAYGRAHGLLKDTALDTLRSMSLVESLRIARYKPTASVTYGKDALGTSLRTAAAMLKADIGVEAIHIDVGGWDTHALQNPVNGQMSRLMASFAAGLAAFHADVVADGGNREVVVVAMSEFGRSVSENGSRGTDHGRGGAVFLLGGHVDGGRVLAPQWRDLAKENLELGTDVPVTIDYRDVLAEILSTRSKGSVSSVFDGFVPQFRGIMKS